MILYSKSGDFIGIGKEELSFLGYEDLDEFKSMHKDVADLFVNRPGYIFKFKNFSWIDYTLHSGAPKKSVIIKQKNGNEVEVPIKIKELFLYNCENGADDIKYSVEFLNSMSQNISQQQSESSFIQATPAQDISIKNYDEKRTPPVEKITIEEEKLKEVSINLDNDFNEDTQENTKNDFSGDFNSSPQEDELQMKLKPNEDIFNKEEPMQNVILLSDYSEFDIQDDYVVEEELDTPKLKLAQEYSKPKTNIAEEFSEDTSTNDESESQSFINIKKYEIDEEVKPSLINQNEPELSPTPEIETLSQVEETIEFDLADCAEELNLDISLIAEITTDYIEQINETIPKIKSNILENDISSLRNNIYMLKGISDNLQIKEFSNTLEDILKAQGIEMKENALNKFKKITNQFKREFS